MRLVLSVVCSLLLILPLSNADQWQNGRNMECPHKCMCFGNTVRCMFQKLNRVPRVPTNTTVLDLRFNNIAEIRPGSFHGLSDLHTLLLNDNRIKHLLPRTFEGASNLRILYLYKNRLERISPGAFSGLPNLEQLYLHFNHLKEIRKGTFNDLPSLERLFLHNNLLHHLPADAFHNVGPMTRLRLDSNALVCDCNLVWLVQRLQNKPSEMAAFCQSPNEMKGRSLTSMSMNDFHCTEPRIMNGPQDVEVRLGGTISFTCEVIGDPIPEIKWMRDSNEVSADGNRYVIEDDGTLVISDVTEQDTGEYECMAKSEMGFTKSRKARAVITVSPSLRFTELPESQTVQVGVDASFICKVDGRPAPTIQWWRNGQMLDVGGRIAIEDEGSLLRIFAVKESDSARYVCQAKNSNGYAETSADLRVVDESYSPPKLTYEPHDMEAESGAIIEIPCRVEGFPKPVIQWKKDGTAVQGSRFRVSRGGSLYLYNVTAADTGRYECSAVNQYGRATAQALVRVRQTEAADVLVIRAFKDATEEIDRAINNTLIDLLSGSARTNPLRLARFPDAVGRAAARPAEIFERTLVNIRRMVNSGLSANTSTEFRYEEILTAEQVREIERLSGCTGHRHRQNCTNMCYHNKYRNIDGSCNNLRHPTWGSSYTGFRRVLQPIYENGFSSPVGWEKNRRYYGYPKPSARLVSTTLITTHNVTSDSGITHMVMQWGQFMDHDLDHALPSVSSESWDGIDCKKSCDNAAPCFPMDVPPGDPRVNNRRCIDFIRTSAVCGSGATSLLWGSLTPREQLNQLTSYMDGSQVYGYDDALARDLRDLTTDHGLLREGPAIPGHKPLLPYANGQFVDCRRNPVESSINCFVAGDIRANEQVGLLAMHTIWLREHNRIARSLRDINPQWNGEKLYQEARKIVGAEMQHITYQYWIPHVFGRTAEELLGSYRGYDPNLDASISNVFATAALRFGHTLIQPQLQRLNESFQPIPQGPLKLRDAFFSPWRLVEEGGVDPLMRGMFGTAAKLKLPEENLNSELTEQLFHTAHAVALDLAAMNIQRGRDHALPGYLEWRRFCNMSYVETFEDLADEIRSTKVRQKLRELYGHPGNIDVWVGGVLEDQLPNAKLGPLFQCILLEQFKRTRNGDRFWYESPTVFKPEQLAQIKQTSLARILCDNGDNINRIQPNVFLLPEGDNKFVTCNEIPYVDLRVWSECCDGCEDQSNTISRFRRSAAKYLPSQNSFSLKDTSTQSQSEKIEYLERTIEETEQEFRKVIDVVESLSHKIKELRSLLEDVKKSK
ncbi:peroxidasin homolog isoform X1 [Bombus affinis]|uniref:peroxidasin homolog isoform X1 n=1 Tax=Bombus affinis TaxID=309941 RepID=UPI0021B799B2|nr:peroxidasin homolog isoform X1 [Bombus affinis]XP_050587422.1 peroxidasin homolog isoform X1 [Bombus affinis]XP_050587423.1 peroxidasin homolog isoform X1 [Bombus affinis]XP_050587425.1 peroxidasin homolog isoform X1 [Bombus affinis]XP_050587434.1 peroxidasin homolog isoform X1 [Bombus affinis]XP_050587445.1 peroxidasin homolog isoform X1 [Bombus affinis]